MNIVKWTDRTPAGPYLAGIDRLQEVMQSEIDELRAALQERDAELADIKENQFPLRVGNMVKPLQAEIERLKRTVEETASGPLSEEAYDIAQSKIAAQRKVLAQALNALQHHTHQTRPIHNTELVIEAIQEQLNEHN